MSVRLGHNGVYVGVGVIEDGGRAILHRPTLAKLGIPEERVDLGDVGFSRHPYEDGDPPCPAELVYLRADSVTFDPGMLFLDGLRVSLQPHSRHL